MVEIKSDREKVIILDEFPNNIPLGKSRYIEDGKVVRRSLKQIIIHSKGTSRIKIQYKIKEWRR